MADLRGRTGVLVFYPADWEPVSQEQLVLYREYLGEIARLGGSLIGVSTDNI